MHVVTNGTRLFLIGPLLCLHKSFWLLHRPKLFDCSHVSPFTQPLGLQLYHEKDSSTVTFMQILRSFWEHHWWLLLKKLYHNYTILHRIFNATLLLTSIILKGDQRPKFQLCFLGIFLLILWRKIFIQSFMAH